MKNTVGGVRERTDVGYLFLTTRLSVVSSLVGTDYGIGFRVNCWRKNVIINAKYPPFGFIKVARMERDETKKVTGADTLIARPGIYISQRKPNTSLTLEYFFSRSGNVADKGS